jgi:hypothetical protein
MEDSKDCIRTAATAFGFLSQNDPENLGQILKKKNSSVMTVRAASRLKIAKRAGKQKSQN